MALNNFKQNILNNPKNIFNPYDQSIEGLIANHPYPSKILTGNKYIGKSAVGLGKSHDHHIYPRRLFGKLHNCKGKFNNSTVISVSPKVHTQCHEILATGDYARYRNLIEEFFCFTYFIPNERRCGKLKILVCLQFPVLQWN